MTDVSPSCAEDLNHLAAEVARMGGLAEAQVMDAVDAVVRRDVALAQALIVRDLRLDALQVEVERRALALIAQQGLSEPQLRIAVCGLKLAASLERCGDLARNIAKRSLILSPVEPKGIMRALERMGRIAAGRLSDVVDAYVGREVEQALSIWRRDEEIDDHYESLFAEFSPGIEGRIDEICVSGAIAIVRGHNGGRLSPLGGTPPRELSDSYLMALARGANGTWRITHLIWHRDR